MSTPKQEPNSLEGWTKVINEMGEQARKDKAKRNATICQYMRAYFRDGDRVRNHPLNSTDVVFWWTGEQGSQPILNKKHEYLLESDHFLVHLHEEITRRAGFPEYMLMDLSHRGLLQHD